MIPCNHGTASGGSSRAAPPSQDGWVPTAGALQPPKDSPGREHGGLRRGREVALQEREEKKGLSY